MVFVLKDELDIELDGMTCDFILNRYLVPDEKIKITSLDDEIWAQTQLKNYISTIQDFDPLFENEAEELLVEYYKYIRAKDFHGRTTVRALESLVRLSQAHARLMFREEVVILDVVVVILVMENAFDTACISIANFKLTNRDRQLEAHC